MKFLIIKCVNVFLIFINIFDFNVDAFNDTDLKIICAPRWGTEITPTVPQHCTTLSLSRFDKDILEDLNTIKGALPLMVIDDRFSLFYWIDMVTEPVTPYVQPLIDLGVNIIAINMLIVDPSYEGYEGHPEFTQNIANFFESLKRDHPEMLFGLYLPENKNPIRSSIDLKLLNKHVHFYLLGFIVYRHCEYPNEGPPIYAASKDDIFKTVVLLREAGMDTNKLIYTIDLRIFTMKFTEEDMAYSQVCSKKVSKFRELCYQTIPDIFDKAHLCVQENLLGIYIDNTDYDDINASCKCVDKDNNPIAFKGISVIAGACCDKEAKVESFKCDPYPIITRP